MSNNVKSISISNKNDVLDVRDIIARVEELEQERDTFVDERAGDDPSADMRTTYNERWATEYESEAAELAELTAFLGELCGRGGDEQWRGDWYPVTLVRDTYFCEFAQDEAWSLDLIKPNTAWPYNCIDWDEAARDLQQNYSAIEYDGVTYWYR